MGPFILITVYTMFFFSGAAALIYEVAWVRSLSLVFGGTHLAVTTVLSVFMGGLALGSHLIGRLIDRTKKPLHVYGYLEIGIAVSALFFIVVMKVYPSIYASLAQGHEEQRVYLTVLRVLFTLIVLIIPTTLMGGTLPVLTRFATNSSSGVAAQLSFLYGLNTLGAVAGSLLAGFYLLRYYSVSAALHTAIVINVLIGIAAIALQRTAAAGPDAGKPREQRKIEAEGDRVPRESVRSENLFARRLVLFGIGVSGFCALGYEVLWTRILTLTVGTSVYGFTIILVAFLSGIALGSEAYGFIAKRIPMGRRAAWNRILLFGAVQCIIGITALFVTIHIRDLPSHSLFLRQLFSSRGMDMFSAGLWANATLAFSYILVPSFFMGLAFPLAGSVTAEVDDTIGRSVGSVLTNNTIGAILGSAVSGFVMIYLFGIERSLQLLTVVNIGYGLFVAASLANRRSLNAAVVGVVVLAIGVLVLSKDAFTVWDTKFFAIYQNNRPEAYNTPDRKKDALENTDVLFYHEGVNETISAVKIKGGPQAVLVNGKTVASSSLQDRQCQYTLGHLPMLLHKNPEKVLVVGLGTGMTLGAVSVHPEVKELTLAEIEPNVLGAARTFGVFNNHVLDNSKLKIVFNDGRNYIMTTKKRFDVITADPIHPWTQGSGYLYTEEYFKLASERLRPGGIMCQWLPIYELSVDDLKSVVRTFSLHFKYTMTWMTQYDAELIGSNSPLVIDERELKRRIAEPAVSHDLKQVIMGSADDFLGYFLMAGRGMKAFSKGGIVNTDDNLYLEFSTPLLVGVNVMRTNLSALAPYRESILPYLAPAPDGIARKEQIRKWEAYGKAAMLEDRAHALFLGAKYETPEFRALMADLDRNYPSFAPWRFLKKKYNDEILRIPLLLRAVSFPLLSAKGEKIVLTISAVLARVSEERGAVVFVDNAKRKIYGQLYFDGNDVDARAQAFANDVAAALENAYRQEIERSRITRNEYPAVKHTRMRIQQIITSKIDALSGP